MREEGRGKRWEETGAELGLALRLREVPIDHLVVEKRVPGLHLRVAEVVALLDEAADGVVAPVLRLITQSPRDRRRMGRVSEPLRRWAGTGVRWGW